MNLVITVVNPESQDLLTAICREMDLPIVDIIYGEGTADDSIRSLLGMGYPRQKRVILTIADQEKTEQLKRAEKRYLDIDAPGHGITAAVPIRTVGGGSTLSYLTQNQPEPKGKPAIDDRHELIMCISNNGCTDLVMAAARKAGARGGTVLHAKGTGDKNTPRFYNVTISSEKEVIMIISATKKRNEIMKAILEEAGPATKAGTIAFSLPITSVAGIDEQAE